MPAFGFFQNIGPAEVIIVLAVLLLLFGATRIPQIARALGKSASEFKKGLREGAEEKAGEGEKKSEKSQED